ncbi:MAG: thioredoxin family protein, partial [Planctomycetales bacterium]
DAAVQESPPVSPSPPASEEPNTIESPETVSLPEFGELDEALAQARREGKPLLLVTNLPQFEFGERFIKELLSNPEVSAALKKFHFRQFNPHKHENADLATQLDARGIPDLLILNRHGQVEKRLDGVRPANEVLAWLKSPPPARRPSPALNALPRDVVSGDATPKDGRESEAGIDRESMKLQVAFTGPAKMKLTNGLLKVENFKLVRVGVSVKDAVVPTRLNLSKQVFNRFTLTSIPDEDGLTVEGTLLLHNPNARTNAFWTYNALPFQLTPDDVEKIKTGRSVEKVAYLPDPELQELTVLGVETLVNYRLAPGVIARDEAQRRGATIMSVMLEKVR